MEEVKMKSGILYLNMEIVRNHQKPKREAWIKENVDKLKEWREDVCWLVIPVYGDQRTSVEIY